MLPVRLLPFASALGPTNMAADEAMLESAAERVVASLRFYTWTEPTLSLGYFQPAEARRACTAAELPWVRRSTGGAAIVHHRELTYALALPPGKAWQSRESWVCRFHNLLKNMLVKAGVPARSVACGEERQLGDVLCFLHQTPGDLLIEGSKVAGSAQRKRRGALLQHGSILLARSEHASQLPGINDFAGQELFTPPRLAELLAERFEAEPGDWTDEERDRIEAIRAEKYGNAAWNGKR
jgi:lipoyl(octanoyl) transferase